MCWGLHPGMPVEPDAVAVLALDQMPFDVGDDAQALVACVRR